MRFYIPTAILSPSYGCMNSNLMTQVVGRLTVQESFLVKWSKTKASFQTYFGWWTARMGPMT